MNSQQTTKSSQKSTKLSRHKDDMHAIKDPYSNSFFALRGGALAVTIIIALAQTWIIHTINLNLVGTIPVWLLPLTTSVMLLISIFAQQVKQKVHPKWNRGLSIAIVAWVAFVNVVCLTWFVYDMLNPQTVTVSHVLLLAGIALWIVNVCIFALAYWEVDSGGPEVRALGLPTIFRKKEYPDFVFPQQTDSDPQLSPKDWTPSFIDYLYLSVSNSTSFAFAVPIPYSRFAKLMAASQSLISFLTLGLIIARAISL
jgi:hypothetical protein